LDLAAFCRGEVHARGVRAADRYIPILRVKQIFRRREVHSGYVSARDHFILIMGGQPPLRHG
jgi:hypothetical protein